jgi:hypothetical protein
MRAVISLSQDKYTSGEDGVFFHLSIARGIDPALINCFAAFLDKVVEKSMRFRNEPISQAQHVYSYDTELSVQPDAPRGFRAREDHHFSKRSQSLVFVHTYNEYGRLESLFA